MQTDLPIIQTMLSDWYQLTLNNPLYAAVIATAVFLLTAILYSIRVASLKNKNIASETARIEMQNNLNTAQQQMQLMQEELTANTWQMQKDRQLAQDEAQRAASFEEQLAQRNKQIAGIIQTLATGFDLGERPLPVTEDVKAEALWQQHARVITLLTTRLSGEQQAKIELQQSYRAETVIRAEQETLIEALQTTLATQTSQFSKLEQELEEQKSMLQQQQDKAQQQQDEAQQVLSQTLEKHQSELARLTELEQQALELVNARQQIMQLEEKLKAKDALITQLEKNKLADRVKAQPQAALIKQDEKETLIELKRADEEAPPAPSDMEQPPANFVKGGLGKIKNLFGGTQPQPEDIKQDEEEIQPEPLAVEQPEVSAVTGPFGKLKNLFGGTQQPEDIKREEEIQPAPLVVEQPAVSAATGPFGKLKNLFGTTQPQPEDAKQDEEEIQPVPSDEEQPAVSAATGQLGKLKNLFGKAK